jgi:GNAT superfamily N-acetyltransferase
LTDLVPRSNLMEGEIVTQRESTLDGPRQARPEDFPAIFDILNPIIRGAKGLPPTIQRDYPFIYNAANCENVLIVADSTRVVCSVGIWANEVQLGDRRLKVGGINCVATLPEYRNQGLGSLTMEAAHRRMKQLGCHIGLLGTGITNWYRKLGWENAGRWITFYFDRGNIGLLSPLPAGVTFRMSDEHSSGELVRLRNADRLGGIRDEAAFTEFLRARGMPGLGYACKGDRPIAYVLARGPAIQEWGGPADVLPGLIRAWFEKNDDPGLSTSARDASFRPLLRDEMSLSGPASGHQFLDTLADLRIPSRAGFAGMMYLVDPQGILDAFGVTEVRLFQHPDGFTLTRGSETCTLTRGNLAKLFFGPEKIGKFGADIFPLPFCQWPLEHV